MLVPLGLEHSLYIKLVTNLANYCNSLVLGRQRQYCSLKSITCKTRLFFKEVVNNALGFAIFCVLFTGNNLMFFQQKTFKFYDRYIIKPTRIVVCTCPGSFSFIIFVFKALASRRFVIFYMSLSRETLILLNHKIIHFLLCGNLKELVHLFLLIVVNK